MLSFSSYRLSLVLLAISLTAFISDAQPVAAQPVAAQPDQISDLEFRQTADSRFRAQLTSLAKEYDSQGQTALAKQTREWFLPRSSGRQIVFVPPIGKQAVAESDEQPTALEEEWQEKFQDIRNQQADRLWKLVDQSLVEGKATRAVQLIYEILRERPADKRAIKALGLNRRTRKSRAGSNEPARPMLARNAHQSLGWPAKGYWRLQTDHFLISTNHSESAAEELAVVLEEFYGVWQQLYVTFWTTPASIRQSIAGRGLTQRRGAKHRVVLFKSRDEYVQHLVRLEPQAKMTLGLYRDNDRTAYFFADDQDRHGTWRHEVAHQLFYESTRRGHSVGEDKNFWLIEGLALYLESLQRQNGYYTVGGFDSERLQFARYRALHEGFYVPLEELSEMGRVAVQQDSRIRRLYSQSAGLVHFLMNGNEGAYQEALVDLSRSLYRGEDSKSLAMLTEKSFDELDREYREFLHVSDDQLSDLPLSIAVRKLCLGRSASGEAASEADTPAGVTDAGLRSIAKLDLRELDWLDLAHCPITDAAVEALPHDLKLVQLNLEGTNITDRSIERIGAWNSLEELDLSGTAITDRSLTDLGKLTRLRVLWLTGTKVTNEGLQQLAGLKHLEMLDVGQTNVTSEAWDEFKSSHPRLSRREPAKASRSR